MTLKEFLALPGIRGCQAKMILGRSCHDATPLTMEDLEDAVMAVYKALLFVGLTEDWESSVNNFHQFLGGKPVAIEYISQRQTASVVRDDNFVYK